MFDFAVAEKEKSQGLRPRPLVVGCFEFCGPFRSFMDLCEEGGVIAILRPSPGGGLYQILNIYYTANVKSSAFLELADGDALTEGSMVAVLYTQVLNAESATNLASHLRSSLPVQS
ncbi:MAG: hypothetical protein KGS72_13625 [Cyanobacteria bacterium REEB67]|nr:hypothetical protein [Cyanobacteria bacterium REEB67]